MKFYERHALDLAMASLDGAGIQRHAPEITHLIVTSCTGFYAPGLDLQLAHRLGLDPSVERTIIGFMGCYAAMNALKLARHIVRSEPQSEGRHRQPGTMHPAPPGDRQYRGSPELPDLRRRLFRQHRQRRAGRDRAGSLPHHGHPRQRRPDHLAYRPQRLRHASGGHRSRHHRQRAARARCRRS